MENADGEQRIEMKGFLLGPAGESARVFAHYPCGGRGRVRERRFQFLFFPFVAVNRSRAACFFNAGGIVARRGETVEINRWYPA